MEIALGPRLGRESGARIARSRQVAEGQDRRIERIEDVELQAGREPPILVLQLQVGLEWQDAINVLNEGAVIEADCNDTAGLKSADLRSTDECEKRALAGIPVEGLLIETQRQSWKQEKRRARRDWTRRVVQQVADNHSAKHDFDIRIGSRDGQVLRQRGELLFQGAKFVGL